MQGKKQIKRKNQGGIHFRKESKKCKKKQKKVKSEE